MTRDELRKKAMSTFNEYCEQQDKFANEENVPFDWSESLLQIIESALISVHNAALEAAIEVADECRDAIRALKLEDK